MATIIFVTDLPSAIQSDEMAQVMVDGANAKASRVAPCLAFTTSTTWAASTAYAVGDAVVLGGGGFLKVTVAGTSGTVEPVAPSTAGATVTDGTVTWERLGPTADQLDEARLVLIGAVKRWAESGAGSFQTQAAGPFSMGIDTRQKTGYNLWPSEIESLQSICKAIGEGSRQAFSIDTAPVSTIHADWCAINFGATYCDCGADIAGYPIFGQV